MPVHHSIDAAALATLLLACSPPTTAPASRQAGAIMAGTNGSLWMAVPAVPAEAAGGMGTGIPAAPAPPATASAAPAAQAAAEGSVGGSVEGSVGKSVDHGHHWELYLADGQQESLYWVHDNGGRPFLVRVTPQLFAVYKLAAAVRGEEPDDEYLCDPQLKLPKGTAEEWHHPRWYTQLVAGGAPYLRVWAAEDPATPEDFGLGNTLLVQLTQRKHLFIAWQVESFELEAGETIQRYESPIGNSDVPYPYAVSETNTYLMIENMAYIPNALRLVEQYPDPYAQFWARQRDNAAALEADPDGEGVATRGKAGGGTQYHPLQLAKTVVFDRPGP